MNTKLSVALLSGLSLFMSIGAFAVSEERSDDYINWSYAMGEDAPKPVKADSAKQVLPPPPAEPERCTVGCPGRPESDDVRPLTLTYEDEATPIIERVETFTEEDRFLSDTPMRPVVESPRSEPDSMMEPRSFRPVKSAADTSSSPRPEPTVDSRPQVETQYVQSAPKVQYPITRQYPISVQYPVTVQRNMTVEQPVIMQQPVIVRRPVVMQQDITVQRQPTVIQHQPLVMQQQPTYVQQQPVFIQAPSQPVNPAILAGLGGYPAMPVMPQPVTPQPQVAIPQPTETPAQQPMVQPDLTAQMTMPYPTFPLAGQPQQYQVQGQIQAQPVYGQPMYMPMAQPTAPAMPQQQMFLTPTY